MRSALGIVVVLLVLATPSLGQESFTSMRGDWWLDATRDNGIVKFTFSEEQGSSFEVTGAGFSRGFATFWAVSDEAAQTLDFDFEGNITGTLDLEDLTQAEALGTLQITRGSVNSTYTKIKLKGLLTIGDGDPLSVTIKGGRLPAVLPAWVGRTHKATLTGDRVKSTKYDIRLEHAPLLGFPFLLLTGDGSVKVDGVSKTSVALGGVLLASPSGKLYGEFLFDMVQGTARGTIAEKDIGPKIKLKGKVPLGDGVRRVRVRARLDIALTDPL